MTARPRAADDFEFIRRRLKEVASEPRKEKEPESTAGIQEQVCFACGCHAKDCVCFDA
jgi:hypothetical protein